MFHINVVANTDEHLVHCASQAAARSPHQAHRVQVTALGLSATGSDLYCSHNHVTFIVPVVPPPPPLSYTPLVLRSFFHNRITAISLPLPRLHCVDACKRRTSTKPHHK